MLHPPYTDVSVDGVRCTADKDKSDLFALMWPDVKGVFEKKWHAGSIRDSIVILKQSSQLKWTLLCGTQRKTNKTNKQNK